MSLLWDLVALKILFGDREKGEDKKRDAATHTKKSPTVFPLYPILMIFGIVISLWGLFTDNFIIKFISLLILLYALNKICQ